MAGGGPIELHELLSDQVRLVGERSLTVTLDPQGEPAAIYRARWPGGGG